MCAYWSPARSSWTLVRVGGLAASANGVREPVSCRQWEASRLLSDHQPIFTIFLGAWLSWHATNGLHASDLRESRFSRFFFLNFTSRSRVIFISFSLLDLDFQSFLFHFHFSISISSHYFFTCTSRKEWMAFFLHFSLLDCPKPTLAGHCARPHISYTDGQRMMSAVIWRCQWHTQRQIQRQRQIRRQRQIQSVSNT